VASPIQPTQSTTVPSRLPEPGVSHVRWFSFALAAVTAACLASCCALAVGWQWGSQNQPAAMAGGPVLPQLHASASAIGDSMAVATGAVSEDSEGVFFLDFNTGDLQCMVFYPRAGAFGAHYFANVLPALGGGGKNSKYLMVTGQAVVRAGSGNTRPAASLVYITDVTNGTFAAYAVPWDRTAESAGRPQSGPLILVSSGSIRNYRLPDPNNRQPAGIVDPNKR
jgi:hypothetical protein